MPPQNRVILLATVLLLLSVGNGVLAEVSVGVKKGDWIEYQVTTTGIPQEGHDVTWARMEILDVEGTDISVNVTTKARNGTYESGVMNLNPAKGQVGVWFIIPANLNVGQAFFDASIDRNVTIEGSKQMTIAGATRTITHSTTPERVKSWDKVTGVFVESIDVLPNYTLNAIADKTNLWSGQILGLDSPIFYTAALGAAVVLAAVILVVAGKKIGSKNRASQFHSS